MPRDLGNRIELQLLGLCGVHSPCRPSPVWAVPCASVHTYVCTYTTVLPEKSFGS
jgi:hypothetical protein